VAAKSLIALLHRANQIANEEFERSIPEGGVTARQVQVLSALSQNEGCSQTDLCDMTGIDRSTMAEIVSRLHKRRLIERRRSKEDARAYVLKLSESGRSLAGMGEKSIASVEETLMSALSGKARQDLLNNLDKLVASDR
jgi:DNA-binding MarR family transcriptional regulator